MLFNTIISHIISKKSIRIDILENILSQDKDLIETKIKINKNIQDKKK
jgi:hypothetical protein